MPLWRRHWTPRYLRDRVRLAGWQRRHPDDPWLVDGAIHFLDQWLRKTDVLVEFGSGRSTVWFAQRVRLVISVEHDQAWHSEVTKRLTARGLTNVRYHYVADRPRTSRYPGEDQLERPGDYTGAAEADLRDTAADGRADLILVDGCSRDHCAIWALPRVRPGGLIVVDNANWYFPTSTCTPGSLGPGGQPPSEEWRRFGDATSAWRRVWFSNGVTDTLLLFVPAA